MSPDSPSREAEEYVRNLISKHTEYSQDPGIDPWFREYSAEIRNLLLRALGLHVLQRPEDIEVLPIGSVIADATGRSWIRESRIFWIGTSRIRTAELVWTAKKIKFYIRYQHTPSPWVAYSPTKRETVS